MAEEWLKVFDGNYEEKGKATRMVVHSKGLWHETVHFWLITKIDEKHYLFLQKRSKSKADYPDLYDISAAGHLLATESPRDGLRELQEELGFSTINIDKLHKLGIVKNIIHTDRITDNEFSHIYVYMVNDSISFHLQEEEVSEMVITEFDSFYEFCTGARSDVLVYPWQAFAYGSEKGLKAGKDRFVPHQDAYFREIAVLLKHHLEQ